MTSNIYQRLQLSKINSVEEKYNDLYIAIEKNSQMNNVELYESSQIGGVFFRTLIKISIPSRGVYHNLAINKFESIIVYVGEKYPLIAPSVMIERDDFPYSFIPHLNMGIRNTKIDEMNLCLYRGDIDEWYLKNGAFEFCDLINEWFSDLVNGTLIKEDGFESIRINNSTAVLEADFEKLSKKIEADNKRGYIFLEAENIGKTRYVKVANNEYYSNDKNALPCILIFDNKTVDDCYFTSKLSRACDLSNFSSYNKLSHALQRFRSKFYDSQCEQLVSGIWIIMAVKRNQQVIGTFSHYEFIAFRLMFDFAENPIVDNCKIELGSTIQTLNKNIAEKLSGTQFEKNHIAIIGCGALGSKISMSLSKMGYLCQKFVDNDILLPHNFVRHEVNNPFFIGQNKAQVINYQIKALFQEAELEFFKNESFFSTVNYEDDIILDCTASERNLYWYLVSQIDCLCYCRSEIFMDGRLGVSLFEGSNHNPDIYDTRVSFFNYAIQDDLLKGIFVEKSETFNEFHIGFGCSSDTMILDDATISNHASIVPHILENGSNSDEGIALLNYFDKANLTNNFIKKLNIGQFKYFDSERGWKIHISLQVLNIVDMYRNQSVENMGLWFGCIDENIKRITVVETYIPPDNLRTESRVTGGTEGVSEKIDNYERNTNGTIRYIGEWHTHPMGKAIPSEIDKESFDEFGKLNKIYLMSIFGKDDVGNWVIKGVGENE